MDNTREKIGFFGLGFYFIVLWEWTTCLVNREGEECGTHLQKNEWVYFHKENASNFRL